ncbi:MAG TPA: hypothetical protein VF787_25335 [Thermoanaerobaculia bacterium]
MAALGVCAADSPDTLLERGLKSYRAANYAAAVTDLDAASKGYLTSAEMEQYVQTGRYERIESLETSLVYLALAQFKVGSEDAARDTIQRLLAADRIRPTYATLPLAQEAADFESIAAALVPGSGLRNTQLASATSEDSSRPLPPVKAAANSAATPPPTSVATRDALTTLRQADEAANGGDATYAETLYARVATAPDVSREVIAESAIGLYRLGAYRESAAAFRRIGTFARGEEDLRYYFAVALYESGEYHAAQKELACALPFIEATEDVLRYRWKIENTAAVVAMK